MARFTVIVESGGGDVKGILQEWGGMDAEFSSPRGDAAVNGGARRSIGRFADERTS